MDLGFERSRRNAVRPFSSSRNAYNLNARELDAKICQLTAIVSNGKATQEELDSLTRTLISFGYLMKRFVPSSTTQR